MENIKLKWTATCDETINDFMVSKGFSPNQIYHEIKEKNVLINSISALNKESKIMCGDLIEVTLNPEKNDLIPNDTKLDILYEDEYILLVNKPQHVLSEPYKIGTNNNLASMVANYFNLKGISSKSHLVNRLDRDTSGIVVIAKNRYIKNLLCKTKIEKKYNALVEGETKPFGTIEITIDKDEHSNIRKTNDSGKKCFTEYETISYDSKNNTSLVDVKILTGRTHQIRLSFSSIGHPLLGDKAYGSTSNADMLLVAYYTKFIHPISNEIIEINLRK